MPLAIYVGGSGQHVALMTSRLMLIRALPPDFTCHVVDADDEQAGVAGVLQSLEGYVKPGYSHPLRGVEAYLKPFDTAALAQGEDDTSFRTLFRVATDAPLDGEVFDALFTPEQANQDIREGFFAMPALGASAFAAQGAKVIKQLEASTQNADKVFIIGSFIGGTGAGVIPSAVKQLVNGDAAKWFGIFLLNWLDPPADSTVSLDDMVSNRQHGLDYFYDEVRPNLKASVLMGPPPTGGGQIARSVRPSRGSAETRSFYPLLASRAMYELSTDAMNKYDASVLIWSHDDARPDELLDRAWDGSTSLRQRLHDVERAHRWLTLYDEPGARERLKKAFGLFGTKAAVPRGLHDIPAFAKAADIHRDEFIDGFLTDMKHRVDGLYVAYNALRSVFGGVGGDVTAKKYEGRELDGLRSALDAPFRPDQKKGKAERLVEELSQQVLSSVLNYREIAK